MAAENKKLSYIIIALLAVNTVFLGGIFLKLCCPTSSFCPMGKSTGKMCPITGKMLKGSMSQPAEAPAVQSN